MKNFATLPRNFTEKSLSRKRVSISKPGNNRQEKKMRQNVGFASRNSRKQKKKGQITVTMQTIF